MADWEQKVAEERARRDASIAKLEPQLQALPTELPLSSQKLPSEFLTDREIEITERYTVPQLLAALKARKISVEEVTRAFLRRAVIAHQAASQPPTFQHITILTKHHRPTV
jgi:amidase